MEKDAQKKIDEEKAALEKSKAEDLAKSEIEEKKQMLA